MYNVVVEECVVILQYLTTARHSTHIELPLQLPACRYTINRSNDCLRGHSTDQNFHSIYFIDSIVVYILDNKLVEGLVLNVCTLSMCFKMLVENEYEGLFFKTLFIPSANSACKDPSNKVRVRVRVRRVRDGG